MRIYGARCQPDRLFSVGLAFSEARFGGLYLVEAAFCPVGLGHGEFPPVGSRFHGLNRFPDRRCNAGNLARVASGFTRVRQRKQNDGQSWQSSGCSQTRSPTSDLRNYSFCVLRSPLAPSTSCQPLFVNFATEAKAGCREGLIERFLRAAC